VIGVNWYGANNTVINCVALNKEIKAKEPGYGRITSSNNEDGPLTNNYGRKEMELIVDDKRVDTPPSDANGGNGAEITDMQYHSLSWWSGTAKFSTDFWDFDTNRLPHLKGEVFKQVQNPKIIQ